MNHNIPIINFFGDINSDTFSGLWNTINQIINDPNVKELQINFSSAGGDVTTGK